MLPGDPRRCDSVASDNDADASDHEGGCRENNGAPMHAVPLIRSAIAPTPLEELARREPFEQARALDMRLGYCIESVDMELTAGARNFVPIQDAWDHMLRTCADRYSDVFWKFFLALHRFSQVTVDTALVQARRMPFFPKELHKSFPQSRRVMMSKLDCIPKFWQIVEHKHRIDVSHFNLPSGTRFIDFEFIDPIWGWLLAARRHHPADLHWIPRAKHRTQAPLYGGGVQYGEFLRHAYTTRAEGSFPMLVTLHWDGTFGRGLDVTPIAVGVGNINNCDESKETCIAYVPSTPDQSQPEYRETNKCTE